MAVAALPAVRQPVFRGQFASNAGLLIGLFDSRAGGAVRPRRSSSWGPWWRNLPRPWGPWGLFRYQPDFPVFYTEANALAPFLETRGILISSFAYPTPADTCIIHVVLNALHTTADVAQEPLPGICRCTLGALAGFLTAAARRCGGRALAGGLRTIRTQ